MAFPKKTIIFTAVILGAGYFGYQHFMSAPDGAGKPAGGGMPVAVAQVIERDVQLWKEFSGRLTAIDSAEIRPRVTGVMDSIHFKEGESVKKGDLLFVIDPRPYEAALKAAEAKSSFASADLKRAEKLMKEKAISKREFQQRKDAASAAQADFTTAKLNLAYTHITSPIAGKVGRAEITVGNLVEAVVSAPVLTTVVANSRLYADFEVDENTYLQYTQDSGIKNAKKLPVQMGLANEEGTPHVGHIQSFDNRLDAASGTIRTRAVFDNKDGSLVPGLFARIRLGNVGGSRSVLITDRAVGTDQDRKFVYVVNAENKIEYRPIVPGPMADGLQVVKSGLKAGEKIVLNILPTIFPGMPVTPQVEAMISQPTAAPSQKPEEKK